MSSIEITHSFPTPDRCDPRGDLSALVIMCDYLVEEAERLGCLGASSHLHQARLLLAKEMIASCDA